MYNSSILVSGDAAMEEAERNAWGERVVRENRTLFHIPTQTFGVAVEWFDGVAKRYGEPGGVNLVSAPVLRFEEGHVFFASDVSVFLELTQREVTFIKYILESIARCLHSVAVYAYRNAITESTCAALMIAILKTQTRALQETGKKE